MQLFQKIHQNISFYVTMKNTCKTSWNSFLMDDKIQGSMYIVNLNPSSLCHRKITAIHNILLHLGSINFYSLATMKNYFDARLLICLAELNERIKTFVELD